MFKGLWRVPGQFREAASSVSLARRSLMHGKRKMQRAVGMMSTVQRRLMLWVIAS